MGTISRAVVWVDGQYLNAADLNGEFNIIHDEFNGNIDDANIKVAAAIAGTKVSPNFGAQAVRLQELAADPSALANIGGLYTKDVGGGTELFYRDAAGNVVQVTSGGVLSSSIIILPGYIYGCGVSNNAVSPSSVVDVALGALEVDNAAGSSPEIIEVTSVLQMNLAASGANGLDTGSPAINWYHVYVIYDPTGPTVASMCSLSATSPTLPGGYTKFRRVGSFYNTAAGSASIRAFFREGAGPERSYFFAPVNTGNSLAQATSWTSHSIALAVPATATRAYAIAGTNTTGNSAEVRLAGDSNGIGVWAFIPQGAVATSQQDGFYAHSGYLVPIKTAQTIYYMQLNGGSVGRISITGYQETL